MNCLAPRAVGCPYLGLRSHAGLTEKKKKKKKNFSLLGLVTSGFNIAGYARLLVNRKMVLLIQQISHSEERWDPKSVALDT